MGLASDTLKVVDAVLGRGACVLLAAMASRRQADAREVLRPRRVLVIRPGGIGDAVLLFPMLQAMRAAWPAVTLHVLAEGRNAGIFRANGVVDRVLRYDRPFRVLRQVLGGSYDLVVDSEQTHYLSAVLALMSGAPHRVGFATNRRRGLFTRAVPYSRRIYEVHSFLDLFRAASGSDVRFDPEEPFFPLDEPYRRWAGDALASLAPGPLAVIHPGASTRLRRWSPTRYREVALNLLERGMAVAVIGGSMDRSAAAVVARELPEDRVLDLAGRTNLAHTAAVIARAALYISADTGPLHLAYGLGVPTVHLFGPGELEKWAPTGRYYRTVRVPVPCSPCTRYGATPPCCHGVRCMEDLQVAQVVQAIGQVLET